MASIGGAIQVLEWEGPPDGEEEVDERGERCSLMRRRMSTGREARERTGEGGEGVGEYVGVKDWSFGGGGEVVEPMARGTRSGDSRLWRSARNVSLALVRWM